MSGKSVTNTTGSPSIDVQKPSAAKENLQLSSQRQLKVIAAFVNKNKKWTEDHAQYILMIFKKVGVVPASVVVKLHHVYASSHEVLDQEITMNWLGGSLVSFVNFRRASKEWNEEELIKYLVLAARGLAWARDIWGKKDGNEAPFAAG